MGNRGVTLVRKTPEKKIPRCPFCHERMEEVQLKWEESPVNPLVKCWHEVWGCDSCHTNHVFPARLEFLQAARKSMMLERSHRVLHLPK